MPAIGVTLTSAPLSVIPSAVVIATREEHGTSSVPVAAIVGGIAAGAFLAVVVTIAVLWWGKSVERVQLKEWREAVSGKSKLNKRKYLTYGYIMACPGIKSQNKNEHAP